MKKTTFRAPATSQNVTKCCACHEKSDSTFTKYCACHDKSLSWLILFTCDITKCCACHKKCALLFSSILYASILYSFILYISLLLYSLRIYSLSIYSLSIYSLRIYSLSIYSLSFLKLRNSELWHPNFLWWYIICNMGVVNNLAQRNLGHHAQTPMMRTVHHHWPT